MTSAGERIRYKRSSFSTRLPTDLLYTPSHCWLRDMGEGLWQVGWTKFATRMLGELVEIEFQVEEQQSITVGETLGWVEGFKAVTDLYGVINGQFVGGNKELREDIPLLARRPYREGWLYLARGQAEPNAVDVHAYIGILNATIDKMLDQQKSGD